MRTIEKGLLLVINLCILINLGFSTSQGELAYSLFSPEYLGKGPAVTDMSSPESISINPAAAGEFQRIIVDGNYINLSRYDSGFQGMGHSANLAGSFPTQYGVISSAFHFITTDGLGASSMDFGTFGLMDFAFSKEVYDNIYLGFSLRGALGSSTDWGLGLNLGLIYNQGQFGPLKGVKWGLALNDIGKMYGAKRSGSYLDAIPENLTLRGGISFDAYRKKDFIWTVNGDIALPSFTDLTLNIGQSVLIQDKIGISTSSYLSIADAVNGDFTRLIPSASVFYRYAYKTNKPEEKSSYKLTPQLGISPLYNGVLATGLGLTVPFGKRDNEAPDVEIDYSSFPSISPDLNGVQDELNIPFSVDDQRFIASYQIVVKNSNGEGVKIINNKELRPENETFKNIFSRLFAPKKGIPIPKSFRFDGLMDSGERAPDGLYTFSMNFSDDNGNTFVSKEYPFLIDTVAPQVKLKELDGVDLIFSPDGDGRKDSLLLGLSGSKESLWSAKILDQNQRVLREYTFRDGEPQDILWDGKDEQGTLVPDGVYNFLIEATDSAGNYGSAEQANIIVNTVKEPIYLNINSAFISPENPQGINKIVFTPDLGNNSGLMEWTLSIKDKTGQTQWAFYSRQEGVLGLPQSLDYKGLTQGGVPLKEGAYQGVLSVEYQNGYKPEVFSPWFTVDSTPPTSQVSGDEIFSPDGDGFKDSLNLKLRASVEDFWEGKIYNEADQVVKTYFWRGTPPLQLSWDSRDDKGQGVADGTYTFTLSSVDDAGNKGLSLGHSFLVDRQKMSAMMTLSYDAFSPNGDGVKDIQKIFPLVDKPDNLSSWTLSINQVDSQGSLVKEEVKSWSGTGRPQDFYIWNGVDQKGKPLEDGFYQVVFSPIYTKGDRPKVNPQGFILDRKAPLIKLTSSYELFSPDGDGLKDNLILHQEGNELLNYEGLLINSSGEELRKWYWKGELDDLVWDGTDQQGNLLKDGSYGYILKTEDKAGNLTSKQIDSLVIDTKATPLYLTAQYEIFSPLSLEYPEQIFTTNVGNPVGIESWQLNIVRTDGSLVKQIEGLGAVPKEIKWDGQDDQGRLAPGELQGELRVQYNKGNTPRSLSRIFTLDNDPPLSRIVISPKPFSPDDDNVADELKISIAVKDLSPIAKWSLQIKDPKGNPFIDFGGTGSPSERIIWDGRSRSGELVLSAEDYSYEFSVSDVMGHTSFKKGLIPVDILVMKEGDQLKVRISNITFKPNLPELVTEGADGEKNKEVLKRLAEVLKKYNTYNIAVEGHAVSVYYDNPIKARKEQKEELIPLSTARAQVVVEKLHALGIPYSRLEALGRGGEDPIVSHGDYENRWKNRRVEFILIK